MSIQPTRKRELPRLGATWSDDATSFAIFSEHATAMELCIFDESDHRIERDRIQLCCGPGFVWFGTQQGLKPGTPYGFRVSGPYKPNEGHRFNPAKVVLDPYARALHGVVDWSTPVYGYRRSRDTTDAICDRRDDGHGVPKSIVVDPSFDWEGDCRLLTHWENTLIYELHVKGFSRNLQGVPDNLRGTYAGLGHAASIEHLTNLGVSAVELLPVHAFMDDHFLVKKGLKQYWGYNTLGFFAPEGRYSSAGDRGGQVAEFKTMVKSLHAAGIEVLLDVVYNHTGEGGRYGPTLAFRGIDNRIYYRLHQNDHSTFEDVTGTGNTFNAAHPQVLKLVMDSLRYWVEEMHVDGFRFDLAPALGREETSFTSSAAFFRAIHQDPLLSTVKLIAEPWDVGEGGYQLGSFPGEWREWNDRFRDTTRRFWRGDRAILGELGFRITGSADIYERSKRLPSASINFVGAHDGFTVRDVVSYERKHNLANGELNHDGSNENYSWNEGIEGSTSNEIILARRRRQIKNLIATVVLSLGVPMLVAGDEIGRTQKGNNNAYCQDNEISWIDWNRSSESQDILEFTRQATALRKSSKILRSQAFCAGALIPGSPIPDITWYRPDGKRMTMTEWRDPEFRAFGYRLAGRISSAELDVDEMEQLFVAFNASQVSVKFKTPNLSNGYQWAQVLNSADLGVASNLKFKRTILLEDAAIVVLRAVQ